MAKTYRLGVIGFAHMHVNTLMRTFAEMPNVSWVACADTVPAVPELVDVRSCRAANLRVAREQIGIPKVYDDYRELLAKEQLDLVIFCPENACHGEVAEAIAAHGAHMLTEKPIAASLPEALRMQRAARKYGVELFVNWPTTWSSAVRKAKALLDAGTIGNLWQVKWRGGSQGPFSHGSKKVLPDGTQVDLSGDEKAATWWYQSGPGGGAMLDYCCYGACLSRWYIDSPATSASGIAANLTSHYGSANDNAVITVRFPRALAILEATWSCVDHGVPTGPILYGTTGTLVVERRADVQQVLIARGHGQTPEVVEGGALPAGRDTLAKDIFNHLETGEPVHRTLQADFNLEAMAILDAGMRSIASGKVELVNDATWCV